MEQGDKNEGFKIHFLDRYLNSISNLIKKHVGEETLIFIDLPKDLISYRGNREPIIKRISEERSQCAN